MIACLLRRCRLGLRGKTGFGNHIASDKVALQQHDVVGTGIADHCF
jgi:hypothetical protein